MCQVVVSAGEENKAGPEARRASLAVLLVKNSPAMQETPVQFLGQEDPLGKGSPLQYSWASLVAQLVKNPPAVWETWVNCLVGKMPWKRPRKPTPVFLPGESHGQRSLEGYRPWCPKESDTTVIKHSTVRRLERAGGWAF